MKLQRLPPNFISWRDYFILVFREFDHYDQSKPSVSMSKIISKIFGFIEGFLRTILTTPLFVFCIFKVGYLVVELVIRKMFGLPIKPRVKPRKARE